MHIGDRCCEWHPVRFQKIGERSQQIIDFISGEAFGEVLDARGHIIEFCHHGAEVGLLSGFEQSAGGGNFFQRIFGIEPKPAATPVVSNAGIGTVQAPGQMPAPQSAGISGDPEKNKKKGFWGRIFGSSDDNKEKKPAANSPNQ